MHHMRHFRALRCPEPSRRNSTSRILTRREPAGRAMKHLVEVFWSEDDEGCNAVVPDLPGCSAFGTTPETAVHGIGDATLAWIAACRASGDPLPEPTTKAHHAA